jgi:hypothetical protein
MGAGSSLRRTSFDDSAELRPKAGQVTITSQPLPFLSVEAARMVC